MEYCGIKSIYDGDQSRQMRMKICCSNCSSRDINITDLYCRKCGHQFHKINEYIDMEKIVNLLNHKKHESF